MEGPGCFNTRQAYSLEGANMTPTPEYRVLYLLSASDLDRFWSKVKKTDGCWLWTDVLQANGYGSIGVGGRSGKKLLAHRISYEISHGPIPEGLQIDHLCRVRNCVNPSHLEAVTNRVNGLRGESFCAHHARKTHCPNGHAYDTENTIEKKNGSRACRACTKVWNAKAKMRIRHPERLTTAMVQRGEAIQPLLNVIFEGDL